MKNMNTFMLGIYLLGITFDRKSSQIMRFHGLNDEAQLLVNEVIRQFDRTRVSR